MKPTPMVSDPEVPPENRQFAKVLQLGVRLAMLVMVTSFGCYLLGRPDPLVPLEAVQLHWHRTRQEFAAHSGWPVGWGWIEHLERPDMANMLGLAMLGMMSTVGLASILPIYLRRREWPLAAVLVAQILIVLLAASGLLGGG